MSAASRSTSSSTLVASATLALAKSPRYQSNAVGAIVMHVPAPTHRCRSTRARSISAPCHRTRSRNANAVASARDEVPILANSSPSLRATAGSSSPSSSAISAFVRPWIRQRRSSASASSSAMVGSRPSAPAHTSSGPVSAESSRTTGPRNQRTLTSSSSVRCATIASESWIQSRVGSHSGAPVAANTCAIGSRVSRCRSS